VKKFVIIIPECCLLEVAIQLAEILEKKVCLTQNICKKQLHLWKRQLPSVRHSLQMFKNKQWLTVPFQRAFIYSSFDSSSIFCPSIKWWARAKRGHAYLNYMAT